MDTYYERKITCDRIRFCLTDKAGVDEREIHSYHEILLYLKGDMELFTADGRRPLEEASILIIPKETYHFLKPLSTPRFRRLKISFPEGTLAQTPLSRLMQGFKLLCAPSEEIRGICERLCAAVSSEGESAPFYAYAAFLSLIAALDMQALGAAAEPRVPPSAQMAKAAAYVAQNLGGDLNVKALAAALHVSPSGITHLFKKEFGIPIHKYVLQKRLVHAKHLIEKGELLTTIYADLGFRDYSSFYKAYCNYFGHAPSKDKRKKDEPTS